MTAGSDLPKGWASVTLDELSWDQGYGTSTKCSYEAAGIPVLRIPNIGENGVSFADVKYAIADLKVPTEELLQQGDFLIIRTNGSLNLIGKGVDFDSDRASFFASYLIRYRLIRTAVEPQLVRYFWRAPQVRERLERVAATSAGQYNVSLAKMKQVPINLPPLNEQRRIVAKIEDLTARSRSAKQALDAIPPLLERFRQSVLAAAFRGDLTKQWRQGPEGTPPNPQGEAAPSSVPASELLKRIRQERRHRWEQDYLQTRKAKGKQPKNDKWKAKYKEPEPVDTTNLPELPEGWCWARVEDAGSVQLGRQRSPKHHQGTNMRPYLRVANVFEARIDTSDVMEMNFDESDFQTYKLEHGDILLNEGQSKHLVGRPAIYRDEVPGACFTNTLVRYRTGGNLSAEYALLVFRHYLHCGRFQQIAKWTTSMAHLGAGRFAKVEIPLPPLAEQQQIVSAAEDLLSSGIVTQGATEHSQARLDKLNQSILAKAFRGELVPQDPNDEPASAFLERIRTERKTDRKANSKKSRRTTAR